MSLSTLLSAATAAQSASSKARVPNYSDEVLTGATISKLETMLAEDVAARTEQSAAAVAAGKSTDAGKTAVALSAAYSRRINQIAAEAQRRSAVKASDAPDAPETGNDSDK
jgi:hypothetical protein